MALNQTRIFFFFKHDRGLNSWIAFNGTLTSFWSDTHHNCPPLTKAGAGTGVTVMTINMEDGDDGAGQWTDNTVLDVISIWGDPSVQAKLEGFYHNRS